MESTFVRRKFSDMDFEYLMRVLSCQDISYNVREFLMYNTYYYTYKYYTNKYDEDLIYVEFENSEKELIARMRTYSGFDMHTDIKLEFFDKRIEAGYPSREDIILHMDKLNLERMEDIKRYSKYIDCLNLKEEYINKIKQDLYYVHNDKFIESTNPKEEKLLTLYSHNFIEMAALMLSVNEARKPYPGLNRACICHKLNGSMYKNFALSISYEYEEEFFKHKIR